MLSATYINHKIVFFFFHTNEAFSRNLIFHVKRLAYFSASFKEGFTQDGVLKVYSPLTEFNTLII